MSRVAVVSVVVGLLVIPAVAAADPIPVKGIVDQTEDHASVRLDRGASYSGPVLTGNRSSSRADEESDSPRSLLYGRPAGSLSQFVSTAPEEAAASLAVGSYTATPVAIAPFIAAPVAAPAPMTNAEVSQAFREAFGTVTAAEIAADELAPVVGAMEATDATAVGSLGAPTVFIAEGGTLEDLPPQVHASEPATLILLGSGLLAIARRQRGKNATRLPLL